MADRRRVNGPAGATLPPVYGTSNPVLTSRTGVAPTASGSAYMEIEPPSSQSSTGTKINGMKLICTVHGPRSLPRSAPFSPYLVLSTHVKFAPFATRQRRGYLRDSGERDLSVHLDTALRGVIIGDRWPKSGVDVVVTVVEGDQERETSDARGNEEWDMMNVLSGCVTVAAAALADAGIDCVDMVTGGVAALVRDDDDTTAASVVLDPVSSEHRQVIAACCVAYLPGRGEVTNLWIRGMQPPSKPSIYTQLVGHAIQASKGNYRAVLEKLQENQPIQ
ncbi:Exosome complex component MTR3 [Colletotrichum sidae]|uniref:Exosome complex component MTR3 n=1 Tax=Colletotrichum sidae TaxID=1347389 RepID=A0A4R8T3Z5_9PEZI|nr:Exosome complex component MTR3 [Colletotrichum sidae]